MTKWMMPIALMDALLSCHAAATERWDRAAWMGAMACFALLFEARSERRDNAKRGAS